MLKEEINPVEIHSMLVNDRFTFDVFSFPWRFIKFSPNTNNLNLLREIAGNLDLSYRNEESLAVLLKLDTIIRRKSKK